jgi:branched-chain amino acid transport system substrate-binding protein
VVGSIISETGPAGAQYKITADVLQAWAKYTNAHGGVNGHPVQLAIKDDQSSPSAGIQAANELVNQHVFALVEGASGTAPAWATIISKAGIPVVGGDPSAAPPWGANPDFYGTEAAGTADGVIFDKEVKSLGLTKMGVFYCKEVAACSYALTVFQDGAKKLGGLQVTGQAVSLSSPSYAAPCLAMKSAGTQVVFTAITVNVISSLQNQCAQQGFKPIWVAGAPTLADANNPLLNGEISFAEDFPWFANTPVAQTYRAAMQQYAPAALTSDPLEGPLMWTTGLLFQEAAKKANLGDNPTSAQLISGLNSISNDTLGGAAPPLTFTNGNRSMSCGFLIQLKNGQWGMLNGGNVVCAS